MWRVLVVSLCRVHLAPAIVSAGEDEGRVVEGIIPAQSLPDRTLNRPS